MAGEELDPPNEDPSDTFTQVFGVSEEELRRRGIDPADYVRRNAGKAVRNEKRMASVWAAASQSAQARHQSLLWGLRAFYVMFLTIGILILSTFASGMLNTVALGLAVVAGCAVFVLIVKYFTLIRKWRQLKKAEE